MALIRELKGKLPQIGENCFLAETAVIIGDVEIGNNCSIWYNAVLRGDVHSIKVGNNTNIQDNVTVHATYQKSPTSIGDYVSIAHNAIIHGCTIKNNVLVGMGAIVMDDAIVNENVIIAPGTVVTKKMVLDSGSIYAGIPAKKIKELSPELFDGEIKRIANNYSLYASWYK